MAVRIRLTRMGGKKKPIYRIVVADSRCPRDSRFIEKLGNYNPNVDPPEVVINRDRYEYWLSVGAQPTDIVKSLVARLAHKK